MSRRSKFFYWEAEQPLAGQAPTNNPQSPQGVGMSPPQNQPGNPNQPPQQQQQQQQQQQPEQPEKPEDITQDPQHPDMGGDDHDEKDFEEWKNDYFDLAIKADTQEMKQSLMNVGKNDLDATQYKFVYDNYQIQLIREDANIDKASKEIRKLIKDSLDQNYPATSVMQHIVETLDKFPMLGDIFFKLLGTGGGKGDYHRKFMSALLCAVQSGQGGSREDLIYSERDYSINFSTRFGTEWGEINLGRWALKTDDPQRYLEQPELARLKDGAPEEKTVLRHRIVINSIADQFKERAFLTHVVSPDGTIHSLGWDLGDSLKSGYVDGKLVVRTKSSDSIEAMINDDGNIIPITDLSLKYRKDTGKTDETGNPIRREYPFLERINGTLYLVAGINTIRAMAEGLSGVFFKETSYRGNPSDIKQLMKAVPSVADILLRKQ